MPDTAFTDQLPPRTTTSTRGSRKWATLGGRGTSSSSITRIPTNDSETNKNNGHHRQSSSLFRKASTISRTNDAATASEETNSPSLKKSRSLMNVLRAKLNSPAVLRRFRSKSRESTKQTVTEINGQPTNDQEVEEEIKQTNPEPTTRKSRKRDPSPMRRLANRITQLTRPHKTTSPERQKKPITTDSQQESTSPLHNKNEVEHINACYDEIRAKYFTNNTPSKRNTSTDRIQDRSLNTKSMNGSLLSNDFLDNSPRMSPPLPTSDDPLLQARKQANIKLNCLLSGYSLTTSFANHEKSYGQNDLFKFNHYYDVGKRKYDYNFTNTNNRIFSSMKTRPMSKSIDSFRRTTTDENEVATKLERTNAVENAASVQAEKTEDVRRILPDDNELVIREDQDLIKSEQMILPNSTNIEGTTALIDQNKISSSTTEEPDDEFEQNFLRAVDRALGVVNKDENDLIRSNENLPSTNIDESHLNLVQMTEQAVSSINNSPLFTNDEQKNEQQTENRTELENTEVIDHTNTSLKKEEQPTTEVETPVKVDQSNAIVERSADEGLAKVDIKKPMDEDLLKVDVEKSTSEELSNVDVEKPADENLSKNDITKSADEVFSNINVEESTNQDSSKTEIEQPIDENSSKVDTEKQVSSEAKIQKPADEELPTINVEKPIDTDSSNVDLLKSDVENQVDQTSAKEENEKLIDERSSKVDTEELPNVDLSRVDTEKQTTQDSSEVEIEEPANEELPTIDIQKPTDADSSKADTAEPSNVDLLKTDAEKTADQDSSKVDNEEPSNADLLKTDAEKPTAQESSKVNIEESSNVDLLQTDAEKPTDQDSSKVDIEESSNVDLLKIDAEKQTGQDSSTVEVQKPNDERSAEQDSPKVEIEEATDKEPSNVNLAETTDDIFTVEDVSLVLADLTEKVDESLSEDSKVRSIND